MLFLPCVAVATKGNLSLRDRLNESHNVAIDSADTGDEDGDGQMPRVRY